MNWIDIEKTSFMPVFERVPVTLIKGRGMYMRDEKGKRYLDFVAGIAVVSLGHCHPVLIKAINRQSRLLMHTSNLFYSTPQLKLANLLTQNSELQRVFFANSGAEAVEGAVKLARRWGHLKRNGAYEVISAHNSFHGRTLATIAATGQAKFQQPYMPLPDGFTNVAYDNIEEIKNATSEKTCAVLLEAVQGEGGVNVPQPNYLKEVKEWCEQNNLLLLMDEVQTGVGRCGSLFAYQQSGIVPDVVMLAKGLAGGVPIGAILTSEKASVFAKGEHGSTFGGNPLACAAGYAVLQYIIKHDLASHAQEMGTRLVDGLIKLQQEFPLISDVRGKGLLVGLQFEKDCAKEVMLACLDMGLLVNNLKPNMLRLIPPLIVQEADINKALGILRRALIKVFA
ncbi:MAG: aspartate aminotransferase family protein [Dehalococcoidia bacterium]|nr:aspartate aminotransferase family protein [Dehalococcoidia bacterium]